MALELSGSINISGSMTATTILISSPGAAGMVSSSAQIGELVPLMQSTSSINNLTGSLITTSSNNVIAIDGLNTYTASLKGAAIVSSSQQIQNYFTFAQTSSANTTFYGNITASKFNVSTFGGTTDIYHTGGGHTVITNSTSNKDINYQTTGTGEHYFNSDVNITGGNLVIATSGNGIDFSATSNGSGTTTSELLNDYEEGTWTPVLKGSTTAGTYTYDTDRTNGKYIKIGNQVNLIGVLRVDTVTSAGSGNALIGGIPFAPATIDLIWDRVPGVLSVQLGPTLPSASLLTYTQGNTFSDAIGMGYNGMEGWNQLDVTLVDLPTAIWFFNITYHTI